MYLQFQIQILFVMFEILFSILKSLKLKTSLLEFPSLGAQLSNVYSV
jgi:hypothetical protein